MVLRSREGLENFEDFHGPNIEICEEGDEDDEKSIVEGGGGQLIPSEPRNPAIMFKFTEEDLKCGILAPMGPHGPSWGPTGRLPSDSTNCGKRHVGKVR